MGRNSGTNSKDDLKKGSWTPIEDGMLMDYINIHGEGKWSNISKETGLKRCGKSCRLRWLNYLRPNIKRGNISDDEVELIMRMHKLLGNRWSLIAGRLPGRTDNEIKNFWHAKIAKKAHPRRLTMRRPQTERKQKPSLTPERNLVTTRVTESQTTGVVFDSRAISQQDEVQDQDSLPLMAPSSSTNTGNLEFIRTDHEIESSSNDLTTRKPRNSNGGGHGNHCVDDFCNIINLDSDDHFTMLGCPSSDLVLFPETTVEEKYWWANDCGNPDQDSDLMSVVSFLNSAQEWTGEML